MVASFDTIVELNVGREAIVLIGASVRSYLFERVAYLDRSRCCGGDRRRRTWM